MSKTMNRNNKGVYESKCGQFFVAPAVGSRLRSNYLKSSVTGSKEFSAFMNKVISIHELNVVPHFTDLLHDKQQSTLFLKEFNRDFIKYNTAEKLYKNKSAVSVFMCGSIKKKLIQVYNAKRPTG